jgi:hypothetical protein
MTGPVPVPDDASDVAAPLLGLAIMPTPEGTKENRSTTEGNNPNDRETIRPKNLLPEHALARTNHRNMTMELCDAKLKFSLSGVIGRRAVFSRWHRNSSLLCCGKGKNNREPGFMPPGR